MKAMKALIYVDHQKYKEENIVDRYRDKVKKHEINIDNYKVSCWVITGEGTIYMLIWTKQKIKQPYSDGNVKKLIKNALTECNLSEVRRGQIEIRHCFFNNQKEDKSFEFNIQDNMLNIKEVRESTRYEVLKFFKPICHLPNKQYIGRKIETEGNNEINKYKDKTWICVISNDFAVGREGWKAKAENDYLLFAVSEHRDVISTLRNWKNKYNPKSLYLAVHEPFFQAHKEDIEKMSSLHISFHHIPSTDPVYEAIRSGDVQKIINLILKKILTFLIHRIAHLFLPLDIDLMGICEVLKNDFKPPQDKTKEDWAKEYYNEVFRNTSPKGRFKNLCDQARNEIKKAELDEGKKEEILQMFNCDNINLDLPDNFDIGKFKNWAKDPERNSFHQWFCKVIEKLKKIREELGKEEKEKRNYEARANEIKEEYNRILREMGKSNNIDVKIEINEEDEPQKEELVRILESKEKNLNSYFENPEEYSFFNKEPEEKNQETSLSLTVGVGIFDILGEYKPDGRKIVLYMKNIEKCAKELKNNILKIFSCLACEASHLGKKRTQFPLEFEFVRKALNASSDYHQWVKNITHRFWYEKGLFVSKDKRSNLKNDLQFLKFDENEIKNILFDLVMVHELGHAIHRLLKEDEFRKEDKCLKEGVADLNALFYFDKLKHKVVFYSLAQYSNICWFYYYKQKIYADKNVFEKDALGLVKEIWEKLVM